ncbi:thioredoxin domain-containing protein [Candidatus Kaiserbacteria bacterium]|nr:thioredoxin domain-containing protein [Candidatus Kaiserbacteria bacterium]
METELKQKNLYIPAAIVIAGSLIAGALYLSNTSRGASLNAAPQPDITQGDLEAMEPIGSNDHIRGNLDAKVTIVEYSDFECPFCKMFHPTLLTAVQEYGADVAWVYRHFPLDALHSKARKEAVASECAAELGGNDAFWKYVDRWFELSPSNDQTDIGTVLPQIAREIGLEESKFSACLTSGKYDAHIEENVQNAMATGGSGTPWSIVVTKSGKKYPLSGAQPYENVKQLINQTLNDE